jgi:hypothetical protein
MTAHKLPEGAATDEDIRVLRERYAPSVIPPCRLCGAELSLGSFGGGRPTVWACDGRDDDGNYLPGRKIADRHYSESRYEDYRQGGDPLVLALIARAEKAEQERDELLAAIQRLPVPPADDGDGPDERVGYALEREKYAHDGWEEADLECERLRELLRDLAAAYQVACHISREDAEHGTDADTGHPLDPRYLAAKAALDSAPGAADSTEGSD